MEVLENVKLKINSQYKYFGEIFIFTHDLAAWRQMV